MKVDRVSYKEGDKEFSIVIKKPTHTQLTDANLYASAMFNRARLAGACLRNQIDDLLENQGIWTKEHREDIKKLEKEIGEKLNVLNTGEQDGKKLKLSEGRKLALEIRVERWKLNLLQLEKRRYDEYSVEGQAENARFDHLASSCLLDEEGNKLFTSVDDYFEHADEPHIIEAASKLANMIFGSEDWEKKLEENQFLIKHKLVDENGRLINKQGQHIDIDGQLIKEDTTIKINNEPEYEDDIG